MLVRIKDQGDGWYRPINRGRPHHLYVECEVSGLPIELDEVGPCYVGPCPDAAASLDGRPLLSVAVDMGLRGSPSVGEAHWSVPVYFSTRSQVDLIRRGLRGQPFLGIKAAVTRIAEE